MQSDCEVNFTGAELRDLKVPWSIKETEERFRSERNHMLRRQQSTGNIVSGQPVNDW